MLPDPAAIGPLSEVLRSRREELGLSQADVALAVCLLDRPTVTGNDIARWERGKRIPRVKARRALEQALSLPIHTLDVAAANQRSLRSPARVEIGTPVVNPNDPVERIRAALLDGALATPGDAKKPTVRLAERQLQHVMRCYQLSQFDEMVDLLPELLTTAHLMVEEPKASRSRTNRVLALSHQATAMVLTKVGQHDLAWIASQQGLAAAEASEQTAIVGSLRRSTIHSLQSHGRHASSARLAERTADELRKQTAGGDDEATSVYGTLLLAGSMAAARAGDQAAVAAYLDEAAHHANKLSSPIDHLWTSFGQTNVDVHRVATAVALDDVAGAEKAWPKVDRSGLTSERHARFLFDLAMVAVRKEDPDEAIALMLEAEQLAPSQVYHHVMAQQIVGHLRTTSVGRQNPKLAQLDRRTRKGLAAAA